MQNTYDCTPQQKARLSNHIVQTSAELRRQNGLLSRIRIEMRSHNCIAGLFSRPKESRQCTRLIGDADKVQIKIRELQQKIQEMTATMEGRKHAERHVNACSPNWIRAPVRQKSKAVTGRHIPKSATQFKQIAKAVVKPKSDMVIQPYDETIQNPSSSLTLEQEKPRTVPVHYRPRPINEPTLEEKSVQLERSFTSNPNVRIVGSSFFADSSEPEAPPTRVREPGR